MAPCPVVCQYPCMLQLQKGDGTAPAEGPEAGVQQHVPVEPSRSCCLPQQPTKGLQGQKQGQQDLATVEVGAGDVLGLHGAAEADVAGVLQGTQQQADAQQHGWYQCEEEAGLEALLYPGLGDGAVALTVAPQHRHPGRSPAAERRGAGARPQDGLLGNERPTVGQHSQAEGNTHGDSGKHHCTQTHGTCCMEQPRMQAGPAMHEDGHEHHAKVRSWALAMPWMKG